jgi:hypothetical protein
VRGHTYNGLQGQGVSDERRCDELDAQACLAEAATFLSLRAAAGSLHASAVPVSQQRLATRELSVQSIKHRCEGRMDLNESSLSSCDTGGNY